MISGSQSGGRSVLWALRRTRDGHAAVEFHERVGNLANGTTRSTAPVMIALRGMPSKLLRWILGDHQAALFLDSLQAQAAVGTCSREDHADRALPIFLRQGPQQEVERQTCAGRRLRLREAQAAIATDR